jgi:hypothetical protein
MKGPALYASAFVLGVAGGVVAGCRASAPPRAPDEGYAWSLRPPSSRPDDFLDRQTITATYGDRTARFDAVMQKRGDELTLLGLTPFGARAFVIRQVGLDVTFQSFVPQTMPFPPKYILFDVQRVFFDFEAGDAAAPDGERETTREGEIVRERWQGGRILRRAFRRADGRPPGDIVVDYEGGMAANGEPPAHVSFANGWYGYRLDIMTQSHQRL